MVSVHRQEISRERESSHSPRGEREGDEGEERGGEGEDGKERGRGGVERAAEGRAAGEIERETSDLLGERGGDSPG